ncbi:PREDICTED: uncharacterized protein LOC109147762 [Ipomoea nil]|uniref:uncharacterized protein LOC109147762 n=1 Tax=Ipomoea nil TaxID=35883 RepID=UPI000901610E|nr:PREDICTED: uncharacterized protein LOC109147762 [Ipomoea nil]
MDDRTAINVLHYSLRAGTLYQDFIVHPPQLYDEALCRVTDYANAMEANSAKRRQETGSTRRDTRPDQKRGDRQQAPRDLSRLTRPVTEVLDYAQGCNLIQLPEPGRDGRDTSKFCAYHRNRGHTTDECRVLKEVIEDLLKEGELTQFTEKKDKGKRWKKFFKRSGQDKKDKNQDPEGESRPSGSKQVIHVIFGGPEGGDSTEERHRWCQSLHVGLVDEARPEKRSKAEPIAFTDDDLPRNPDHGTEALIVTLDISSVDVRRVMVDTGSSVNVLYLDVFKKLKLDEKKLTPVRTQLSGFTGATIEPEGMIRLPVEVGTYPRVSKADMEFIVVNLACVHNVILGRPGIAQIGAIISMPHLCMKFQTPAGVGVLRGDIRLARKCYVKAV